MTAVRRPVLFGEVLHDCFPDGSRVLGGAPLNVAWHLRALGLDPLVVSRVGDDAPGRCVLDAMRTWSLDTTGIQIDPARATGEVTVCLYGGEPRFDIRADQAWDAIENPGELPVDIGLLYHGTLALRQRESRAALASLRAALSVPAFVDVNLRDPWWDEIIAAEALDGARWTKLNAQELARLAGSGDEEAAARRLIARHGLERVFVTLGAAGAIAVAASGEGLSVAPASGIEVVDTVGAGDAFAAVLVLGLLADWPLADTLVRAQHLASGICGRRGAVARDAGFYRRIAAGWDG